MKAPWEYLEGLDESVYVVDLETHTLVYMNRCARARFLPSDTEPYVGKKCYTLLQGLPAPCPVCTGHILEEGTFYSWSDYNPVLGRSDMRRDALLRYQGRLYRMELARSQEKGCEESACSKVRQFEAMINGCLVQTCSTAKPAEALEELLSYLGEKFPCSRTGIYEIRYGRELAESYHWPGQPQGKPIPFDGAACPWNRPDCCGAAPYVITARELQQKAPELLEALAPRPEDTILLCPLYQKGALCGFLRLDQVGEQEMEYLSQTCRILSYFIASLLERRDLMAHLAYLSYHDQLTEALNRNALEEFRASSQARLPTGVVYCDINGLKQVNDQMGHAYGDRLIQRGYMVLSHTQGSKEIYRIGGDEFLMVFPDISRASFLETVVQLRATIQAEGCDMTVGCAWGGGERTFTELQEQAEAEMYRAKREYYRQQRAEQEKRLNGRRVDYSNAAGKVLENPAPLRAFIKNYYFDLELFLNSIAMADTDIYLYCGDVQKNLYFISDNLKEDFGFEDNLVYDFIAKLEERIYEGDRQMHIEDTRAMLERKQTAHDIRYRIYKKNDELVWVHCRGILKWSGDGSQALFFSGSMTGLKREAEIDTISGMLSLSGAFQRIAEHCQNDQESMFLCFTLMNFDDINQTYGHVEANQILWELGSKCKRQMGSEFTFIRMDGLRFLAMPHQIVDPLAASKRIRQVIKWVYEQRGIHIIYPCAIGVLRYPRDGTSLQTLMDRTVLVLQAAKAVPERAYVEFSPDMLNQERTINEINLKLNASVSNGFEGFRIVVQPQVTADGGRIFGGEVLLRWQDQGKPVPPSVFIPVLEQMGLIQPVGRWIIEQSVQLCQRILPIFPEFHLSFNISYLQIMDQGLFPFIRHLLEKTGVPGKNLMIELTESHSDTLPKQLERFMEQCRGLGITFALDDFGSGYSSVQMLLQYPVDLVKFDRSMVKEIAASQEKLDFIISTIQTCHQFKKKVCMEGVEQEEELERVRQTKCDYIQGFYYYRPLELDEFCEVLERDVKGGEDRCDRERNP